jgi:hypothetical protein
MCRIEKWQILRLQIRSTVSGFFLGVAALALIPALFYGIEGLYESDLFRYLSIVATESRYLLGNWKVAALSVAESTPLMGSISVVALLLFAISFLRRFVSYRHSLSVHRVHQRAVAEMT